MAAPMPIISHGTTSGAPIRPATNPRPRNLKRVIANADVVPSTMLNRVTMTATTREFWTAERRSVFTQASWYHWVVNPCQ